MPQVPQIPSVDLTGLTAKFEAVDAARQALQPLEDDLSQVARMWLDAYRAANPDVVPCGGRGEWAVDELNDRGLWLSHDCMGHGYDLPASEGVLVPRDFLTDPQGWTQRLQEARQADALAQERDRKERRRRQFATLKAEFEPEPTDGPRA